MVADAAATVMQQHPQTPAPAAQVTPQIQAKAQPVKQPTTQPAPETTSPDIVIEEVEVIEIDDDDDNEQDCAAADKESAILSMIQVYKEADAPPQAPETPCQICATPGEDSVGEQSTDTEITNTAASLLLSYPTPMEMALLSQMSQWLGPTPGTLPNMEQNLQEKISPLKQKSKVEESGKDWSQWDTERSSSKQLRNKQWEGSSKHWSQSWHHSQSRGANASKEESPTWQSCSS